jgi:TorA maturation chaperone TorD
MQQPRLAIQPASTIDPIDHARAREYALLARLLVGPPAAGLIRQVASLSGDASPLGKAHAALAEAATSTGEVDAARAYFELFVGVGRGQLLPYASHYLTGSLCGRPLARIREAFQRLGIECVDPREPEDHIAVLFEAMAGLIGGDVIDLPGADRAFFTEHLAPWAKRFCRDLERTTSATFYTRVGLLGRVFTEIEAEAYSFSTRVERVEGYRRSGEA